MHTPADLQRIKHIKAAARSVVTRTSGLLTGAQQVRGNIALLPASETFEHPAIEAFIKSIPQCLVSGKSRLYVSDAELVAADNALASLEETHRVGVLLECKRIYFACSEIQRTASRQHSHNVASTPDQP